MLFKHGKLPCMLSLCWCLFQTCVCLCHTHVCATSRCWASDSTSSDAPWLAFNLPAQHTLRGVQLLLPDYITGACCTVLGCFNALLWVSAAPMEPASYRLFIIYPFVRSRHAFMPHCRSFCRTIMRSLQRRHHGARW